MSNPIQSAFGMIVGFLPWIVSWSLVGNLPFGVAVVIARAIRVALMGQALLRHQMPKVIEARLFQGEPDYYLVPGGRFPVIWKAANAQSGGTCYVTMMSVR